jgi:undecaprenyl-diphosphatase
VTHPDGPTNVTGAGGTIAAAPLRSAFATVGLGLAALVATLVVLGSLAAGVRSREVFAPDTWATPFLRGIASPGLDACMNAVTELASTMVIVPALLLVAAGLLWRRRLWAVAFLLVANVGALVLNVTMKLFFERPRPELAWATALPDFSFPSGHTLHAVTFYLGLAVIAWSIRGRRVGVLSVTVALAIAVAVGTSRIYLGYHYLTDVVGGFLTGLAWLLVVGMALLARPAWREWRPRDRATAGVP